METTKANFDILPYELKVLIFSQLSVEDLLSFGRCSKKLNQIGTSDHVWHYFKKNNFTDKWSFTAKVDSLSIPIIEKIKKKILLQNNWKNSDLIPNVYPLPQFDGELLHASARGTRLFLAIKREDHARADLFAYDLESLKLINTIEYPEEFDHYAFSVWDGGNYVVIGQHLRGDNNSRTNYQYWVWDLVPNTMWSISSCITIHSNRPIHNVSMHGNYFFYLKVGEGIHVLDLSTRQHVIKQMFVEYNAGDMDVESRGVILFKNYYDHAENDKLKFVQFSEDWQSILFEKELDIKLESVTQLQVLKNFIVVVFFDGKNKMMVFDRKTFNTIIEVKDKISFEVLTDDIISAMVFNSGVYENTVYNLKNNTTFMVPNTDLFHIHSDLFLGEYESSGHGPTTTASFVMSLPDQTKVQELTAESDGNTLHERYTTLFKQFEWYSDHHELERVLANQSQIIVIYQNNQDLVKTAVVILDFCDTVFQH